MNIDRKTIPNFINIVMNDNAKMLRELRYRAEADDLNSDLRDGESKKLCLTEDNRLIEVSEYYFEDGNLYYAASLSTDSGEKIWYSFELPLSDNVLVDILEYSCKKLNKLKTALETLK